MGLASETAVETEVLTLLLIGDGDLREALSAALEAAGQDVEHAELEHALAAVTAAAPDLVVLIASRDGDAEVAAVLAALADDRTGSAAPVVVVGENGLPNVAPNFRHGAVATMSSKLPVAKLAQRLVDIGNGVPDRSGLSQGLVPTGQLGSLLGGLSGQKRTGKLTVSDDKGRERRSLVMKAGESITEPAHEFVAKAGALVEPSGGRFKFEERTTARIDSVLPPAPAGAATTVAAAAAVPAPVPAAARGGVAARPAPRAASTGGAARAGPRLLVVDSSPAQAARLAAALGLRGAEVCTLGSRPGEMDALLDFDPQVVLVSGRELAGPCEASVAAIEAHPRLRWASLLVTSDGMASPTQPGGPALDALWAKVEKLVEPDRELTQGASSAHEFATRLELIGPVRTLRAVASAGVNSRVLIRHPRVSVELAVGADGAIRARARARERGNEAMDGALAIASLFAIQSGRVQVRRAVTGPSGAEPLAALLRSALNLAAPIRPSLVPPHGADAPASEPAPEPVEAAARPPDALPPPPATLRIQDLITAALQPSVSPTPGASSAPEPSAVHSIGASTRQDAPAAQPPPLPIVSGSDVQSLPPDEPDAPEDRSPPPLPRAVPEPPRALFGAPPVAADEPFVEVSISLPSPEPAPEPEPEPQPFASLSLGSPGSASRKTERLRIGLAALTVLLLGGGVAAWWRGARSESEPITAAPAPESAASPALPAAPAAPAAAAPAPAAAEPDAPAPSNTAPAADLEEADDGAPVAADGPHTPERREAARLVTNAAIYRRQGRLGLAEAAYLRALAAFPRYPLAIAGVVRVHLDRKDGREAVRWAEQLVAMQPNRSNNQLLLGDAYALRGQQSAAVKAWKLSARYGNRTARQRLGEIP